MPEKLNGSHCGWHAVRRKDVTQTGLRKYAGYLALEASEARGGVLTD